MLARPGDTFLICIILDSRFLKLNLSTQQLFCTHYKLPPLLLTPHLSPLLTWALILETWNVLEPFLSSSLSMLSNPGCLTVLVVKKLFLSFKPSHLLLYFLMLTRSLAVHIFPLPVWLSVRLLTIVETLRQEWERDCSSCSLPVSISVIQATVVCASGNSWFHLWTSFHIPRRSWITFLRDTSTSQPATLLRGLSPEMQAPPLSHWVTRISLYKTACSQGLDSTSLRPLLQVFGPNIPNLDLYFSIYSSQRLLSCFIFLSQFSNTRDSA